MLAGPMLARFKKAYVPKPGAIKLAAEDWILTLLDFKNWAQNLIMMMTNLFFHLHTSQLKGTTLLLDEPSVTGTANYYGRRNGERHHYHLQCRMRTIYSAALQNA